jgi:hypothetical protein
VLSENANKTGFALEALLAGDGWDWSDNWTVDRLEATLAAMDTLAGLNPENEAWGDSTEQALDATRNGWQTLLDSVALQQTLQTKLKEAGHTELAHSLDLPSEAERSSRFEFRTDTLVHYDVRADNCAWNPNSKEVMLVDWNWAQLGDKRMDMAAMLVNAQRGGLDVPVAYADRLDADALQWLAGFWFRGAATPIWEGGDETLRNLQLESGVRSLRLMSKIEES